VARLRQQPTPRAIAAARGGYSGSRRTTRTRRSWERGKLGEDGTTAMNFAVERRGGASAEKREREERQRHELKTCSPTPGHLRGAALRPPTTPRCSSEPLRPAACHCSAPRRLPRAPPLAARLRTWSASLPAARLRSRYATPAAAHQLHPRSSKPRKSHCPLCSVCAKYLPLPVSTCQRLST